MSHPSKGTREHPVGSPMRGRGVIVEKEHDAYVERLKPPEPAACPGCGVVFHGGRWQWMAAPAHAQEHLCPACRRVRDHYPAGFVTLDGPYLAAHREELMHRVQSHARHVQAEHPLQRIMDIEEADAQVRITTTDMHLARGIGEALHDAYRGVLHFHYEPGETRLRVTWTR